MVKCKNLKIRQKQYNKYFYCYLLKQVITLDCCENCLNFILVRNKGINKVSKKRKFVSKETYWKVYERDKGCCKLCGNNQIQLHHIIYRSENKNLIDEPDNCIMLCNKCHKLVHSNKHYWQSKLKEIVGGKINEYNRKNNDF